ncbi:MAG: bifunctional folylpolyglutamate synthase/dihydrofolate synthase [Alphaproteobacteria bacterium]|nr:MAG: bifunctional folylpolyglutamate synthase/dihydrofolate synthase [Alphaproteobacteria bacterium]
MTIGLDISDPIQSRLGQLAARLQTIFPKQIDLDLSRMTQLLAALGDPHLKLPPVIHVAGTNGKGSCVAYLRAILESAGYRVHAYTSPHLVRFNERIRLAGELIEDDYLIKLIESVQRANNDKPITFFELTTAAAFLAFAQTPADIVLLETGMGGRFDATNVIPNPIMTIITPISMDHMEFLGDTIEKIAYEKAAIQKHNAVSIVGPQDPRAAKVILDYGLSVHSKPFPHGVFWNVRPMENGFWYEGVEDYDLPTPILPGAHQIYNAATAIAAIEQLHGFHITLDDIKDGLLGADWPARMQRLQSGPAFAHLKSGDELWLDGGHNPAAGDIVADYIDRKNDKPWIVIMGMLKNKDAAGFLSPLKNKIKTLYTIPIDGEEKSATPQDLCVTAKILSIPAHPCENLITAVQQIEQHHPEPVRILIAGSLYLAGRILSAHQ